MWTRRRWLETAGMAELAAPAWAQADAKDARRNLKLGIFTGVYSHLRLEEAAEKIRADGFTGVVLEFAFADVRFDPLAPDWRAAEAIQRALDKRGIAVAGLSGYYNVVDPDPERRKSGENRIRSLMANWKRLGSPVVCTETGTFNRESQWMESPENGTEKAWQECRSTLADLARAAEKAGAVLAIEPYWRNVVDSAARAERLFREVRSPALRLVMDPCNYFRDSDLANMRPMLEDIFRRAGGRTALAHAKDVKSAPNGPDLPAAGLGVLDYPLYLRLLASLRRSTFLVLEHLKIDDVPRAKKYVLTQFDRV